MEADNEGDYEQTENKKTENKQKNHDLNYLVSQRDHKISNDLNKCFSKNKKDDNELIIELSNLKELNEMWFKDQEFLNNLDFNLDELADFENFNEKLREVIKTKNQDKTKAKSGGGGKKL